MPGKRPPAQLFDTSILIPLIRGEAYEELFRRALRRGRARMSSVVIQELYAGARTAADKRDLDAIDRAFLNLGYMLTPDHADWVRAGVILARYQRRHGSLDPRKHINDLLILLCAVKGEADLVTENAADMERWGRLLNRGRGLRIVGVERKDYRRS
ncbi:MAG: type II toxin-antitoxin system VapC family toxin [Vicinamibacteria bacterium]